MKVTIIDDNHIMLVASEREEEEYANHISVRIDNKNSFVCNSEPSTTAFTIERPEGGTLFNVSLDISYSRFTTKELLIVYLEMDDNTYPVVIPCYDNEMLMNYVAQKVGILDDVLECKCNDDISMVYPIIIYYGFKLALATFDIRTAINYWERLFGSSTNVISKCGCHG